LIPWRPTNNGGGGARGLCEAAAAVVRGDGGRWLRVISHEKKTRCKPEAPERVKHDVGL